MSTQQIEQALLSEPNDIYSALKSNYQYSQVKPDIDQLCESMRDEDLLYKKKHNSPAHGASAFADAVKIEATHQAEVLWAQRKEAESAKPSGSRPAASHTTCYCCGDRGHYARDCRLASTNCKFCHKTGHLEKMCQKKRRDDSEGEASFFHGGRSTSVDFSGCDSHHGSHKHRQPQQHGEAMTGELINISSSILAAGQFTTSPTTWLCDTGASHHICHRREFFTTLQPISGTFRIKQVEGTIKVTHHGTIMLQVDSATGKRELKLSNVLLIESMQFNILSLQKVLAADYIYTFNLIPRKAVV